MFLFVCDTCCHWLCVFFFFQAEDGIRDLVRSRGLGDVYKRQVLIIEDLIKLLDNTSESLRRGKYPDKNHAGKVAQVLRLSLIHI